MYSKGIFLPLRNNPNSGQHAHDRDWHPNISRSGVVGEQSPCSNRTLGSHRKRQRALPWRAQWASCPSSYSGINFSGVLDRLRTGWCGTGGGGCVVLGLVPFLKIQIFCPRVM